MNHITDNIPPDLLPNLSIPNLDKPIKILMIHVMPRLLQRPRLLQIPRPSAHHPPGNDLSTPSRHRILHSQCAAPAHGVRPGHVDLDLGDYRKDKVSGFDQSISYLIKFMEENGPFDGIVGSSAGATVALVVASLLERQDRCEVLDVKIIPSFASSSPTADSKWIIHATKADAFSDDAGSGSSCRNHEIVYFPRGHYIPRLMRTTLAAAEFMIRALGMQDADEWEDV
ncbi:Ovarian cancer-associated protein 2 [Aspergillus tanneri]|uniref:Ovarian cancer-associated protein 2 n=1 Tax=Aspergillus tanneri TaxID=1220188 RepID=A0A5M9MVI7_9EURO|nr:Ovarian cancer-associated protein 2 [Aspergillus tanneri]KAA8648893.1 Ovarian cancer-associated protein 2 [Aspergillus tanneri]